LRLFTIGQSRAAMSHCMTAYIEADGMRLRRKVADSEVIAPTIPI
jgi:hypothetical protein